jgi:hypothetical protein
MGIVYNPPPARPEQRIVHHIEARKSCIYQDIGERRIFAEQKPAAIAKLTVEVIKETE